MSFDPEITIVEAPSVIPRAGRPQWVRTIAAGANVYRARQARLARVEQIKAWARRMRATLDMLDAALCEER